MHVVQESGFDGVQEQLVLLKLYCTEPPPWSQAWYVEVLPPQAAVPHTVPEELELQAAAAGNPHDLRALKLKAKIALEAFNFDQCDEVIEIMRSLDPDSIDADLTEARNLLGQRTPENAMKPVQRVLAKQPKNL